MIDGSLTFGIGDGKCNTMSEFHSFCIQNYVRLWVFVYTCNRC